MKRLLSLTMIVAMIGLAIISCKDDFNEEDFLRLQSELKLKEDEIMRQRFDSASEQAVKEYIAAANEAGDLLAVSLIVRENGNALAGVTVTLASGNTQEISSGRAKAVTTGVTDATGTVVFDRVTIGRGTASFSKTGYVTATATYDFGTPGVPTQIQVANQNGGTSIRYVPPVKKFEEAAVEMISATPTEGSTATIKGRVTIENDVTNLTPEVPQGIVIRANLTSLVDAPSNIFTSFTLADNNTLGVAVIAADGTYTMQVPATAGGNQISFIVPNIEGTCRMAVNAYEDGSGAEAPELLPMPEYRDVPTSWGPNVGSSDDIPVVAGARVVVPTAPPLGSGLSFSFTPVGRSLDEGSVSASTPTNINNGEVYYRISKRGSFTNPAIPTVTITGGGGTGATATAILQTIVKSITVTDRGEGYDAPIRLQIRANHEGDVYTDLATTSDIDVDADGKIPAFFNLAEFNTNGFGVGQATVEVPENTISISVGILNGGNGTGAEVSASVITDLKSISIDEGGMGFVSAPSINISGGGASVDIVEFPVFWDIEPVMGSGDDYSIVPDFHIIYPESHSQNGSTETTILPLNANGTGDGAETGLRGQLTISGGDVVKKFPRHFRSTKKSHGEPWIVIKTEQPETARFTFAMNAIDAVTGKITAFPSTNNAGNGYNTKLTGQIVPTIDGAPGSGATVQFNYTLSGNGVDYNSASMEWQFESLNDNDESNVVITNQGSGYLPNLNQRAYQAPSLQNNPISVQAGKTYLINFDFGTGFRSINFD